MFLFRAASHAAAPVLRGAGSALEKAGVAMGTQFGTPLTKLPPAYVDFRPLEESVELDAQLWIQRKAKEVVPAPTSFVAPTAEVGKEIKLDEGASIWYNAKVSGSVALGTKSSVLDGASVEGSASKPTVLGSGVSVGPLAKIAEGVQVGDGTKVGAGARIESGVTVAPDAMICEGAVIPSGTQVKTREIWVGSPATKVGELSPKDLSLITEKADEISRLAIAHQKEHAKDLYTVHAERQAFKDRSLWSEDIMEDDPHWSVFAGVDAEPVLNPERRGLLYDK
mmetsp:Transcript_15346/g.27285  ORF Transcript_15346/g.27285 Transcript_15346/m.27285 type:complete len:281 (+) Transcript_15346:237-1079(+)|eukprot:CAMPEP_0184552642 /NCGR_PEP_ID=MMETSP0199_2-20130426/29581_1 /TAXON_ID=1112570 /ORGANISM="Thraustochytrium sp., Strain LLF1b" /LENGTH=280 /DNA_ID=CAMNT_0026948179 /DNA_START=199 /DNA_END=1041 /DNA_ORIENTATION=+